MDANISKESTPKMNSWFNPCAGIMRWDSLDSSTLAFIFIWAGLVFFSENLGLAVNGWSLFFLGAGILVLIEVAIRLLIQTYRTPIIGDLIWAAILFWLGDWQFVFPIALVAIGVSIIYNNFFNNHVRVGS
jgi:uncharacterized membrane protein